MRWRALAEIRVRCPGVPVGQGSPVEARVVSAREVERHRLLARACADGLDVLVPLTDEGAPLVPFSRLSLVAELFPVHPDLALWADLAPLQALRWPELASAGAGDPLVLRAGGSPLTRGAIARITLDGVSTDWLTAGGPARFEVTLAAPTSHLVYYVIAPRTGALPQVVDGDAARALVFQREAITPSGPDPVGASLLATNPDRAVYRFTSDRALPTSTRPGGLSLRTGDHVVFANLPFPPIHHQLLLPGAPPRAAVYRVLET